MRSRKKKNSYSVNPPWIAKDGKQTISSWNVTIRPLAARTIRGDAASACSATQSRKEHQRSLCTCCGLCQRTGGSDRDFAFAKSPRNVRISQLPQPPDGPNCGSSAKAEVLSKLLRIQDWFLWGVRELRVSWWRLQQLANLPKSVGQDSRRVLHVCASHSCDHNVSIVWKQSMLVLPHTTIEKKALCPPSD